MPDLAQWIPGSMASWLVIAIAAVVALYIVLRIVRHAMAVSLRLAILTGTLVVVAVALLVLNSLLHGKGSSLP
jgi:hypothetical protein